MGNYSFVMFARPSLLEGVARALDIGGGLNEYNSCMTPGDADDLAMAVDYAAMVSDMRAAWDLFQSSTPLPEKARVSATA